MKRAKNNFIGQITKAFLLNVLETSVDSQSSTFVRNNKPDEEISPITEKHVFDKVLSPEQDGTDTRNIFPASTSTEEPLNSFIPIRDGDIQHLKALLEDEVCESGIENPSEVFFRKLFENNPLEALNAISTVYMDNYDVDTKKVSVAVSILHLISHLEYNQVYPTGQMMALTAIQHKDKELAEYGIKCYENWGNSDGIVKLKAVRFATDWLQEYADQVIADLNEGD